MTEAMPFLQKYDITFLRPLPILDGSIVQIRCSAASMPTEPIFLDA